MQIDKDKQEESMYRIIKCCGNCKHSAYYRGKQRRLVCLHGIRDPKKKGKPSIKRKDNHLEKFYKKNMYERFPVTHITAVCDYHKSTGPVRAKQVTDWCGAKIMEGYDDL